MGGEGAGHANAGRELSDELTNAEFLRGIVADVEVRYPGIREAVRDDPLPEGRAWAAGVVWMLDRLGNMSRGLEQVEALGSDPMWLETIRAQVSRMKQEDKMRDG